jgi:hypothetical protein
LDERGDVDGGRTGDRGDGRDDDREGAVHDERCGSVVVAVVAQDGRYGIVASIRLTNQEDSEELRVAL